VDVERGELSGRAALGHRTRIGPGGVLPVAIRAACRQSDERTPAGPEPRSTPRPPDSPADLTPPRDQPPGGAPEWMLCGRHITGRSACLTSTYSAVWGVHGSGAFL
jgi:hypothetical protein